MEKLTKHEHIIGDYVIEEIQDCVYHKPDLWIGKVGEEGRVYVGTDWDAVMEQIQQTAQPQA